MATVGNEERLMVVPFYPNEETEKNGAIFNLIGGLTLKALQDLSIRRIQINRVLGREPRSKIKDFKTMAELEEALMLNRETKREGQLPASRNGLEKG